MKLRSILFGVCASVLLSAGVANAEGKSAVTAPAPQASPVALGILSGGLLLASPPPQSCANDCLRRYHSCQSAGGFLCNHRYTFCLRSCSGPIQPTP